MGGVGSVTPECTKMLWRPMRGDGQTLQGSGLVSLWPPGFEKAVYMWIRVGEKERDRDKMWNYVSPHLCTGLWRVWAVFGDFMQAISPPCTDLCSTAICCQCYQSWSLLFLCQEKNLTSVNTVTRPSTTPAPCAPTSSPTQRTDHIFVTMKAVARPLTTLGLWGTIHSMLQTNLTWSRHHPISLT